MATPGQTDCSGTFTAPASLAESGGCTTWSSVVHSDSQPGRRVSGIFRSWLSSLLPGTSSWQATGQAAGTAAFPAAAILVPCSGEPRVMIRSALRAPPSSASHSRATTPPAENPTTSTGPFPLCSARVT
jgi:hypothetical protein